MHRRIRCGIPAGVILVVVTWACSGADDSGPPDADAPDGTTVDLPAGDGHDPDGLPADAPAGDNGADSGDAGPFPDGTGSPLLDRFVTAVQACGVLGPSTVPLGWKPVMVGSGFCSLWVPDAWLVVGAGEPTTTAFADATAVEGVLAMAGTADVATCAPEAVRDLVLDAFRSEGYADVTLGWHLERTEDFGGSRWPVSHALFTAARDGTPLVGYLNLAVYATFPACGTFGVGAWEPQAAIEADTCVIAQALGSLRCGGAACDDSACSDGCKADGAEGGACTEAGACECF